MNPIPLPIHELKPALTGLGKIVNRRATVPALSSVKVERTQDGWILLTATDHDRFVTVRFEQPIEGPPAAFLIPFALLTDIAKAHGNDEKLLVQPGLIQFPLAGHLGEQKFPVVSVEDFPQTPQVKAEPILIPPPMKTSIHQALQCSSNDDTRQILNSVFLDVSEPRCQNIVGTNGRILFASNSFNVPLKESLVLPKHPFLSWKEFNQDGEWKLSTTGEFIKISTRRWRFITRRVVGDFPNWRAILPDRGQEQTHLAFDPASIEALVKTLERMPDPDQEHHSTGIELSQGKVAFLCRSSNEEPWTAVPISGVKTTGKDVTAFADRRYLINALTFGLHHLAVIDHMSPLRFHDQGGKLMIVMPVRQEGSVKAPMTAERLSDASEPQPASPPSPEPPRQPKPSRITMLLSRRSHNQQPPSPAVQPQPDNDQPPATIDEVLASLNKIGESLRDNLNGLRDVSLKLKAVGREHRNSAKEMNSVRSTLRTLQGLRL